MMTRTIEYIKGTSLPAACSTLHIRQTNQRVAFPRYITFLVATSTQFWNVQCHQPTRPMAVKEKSLPTSPYAWSPLYNVICWKSSYFFYSSSALPSFGFSSMLSSPPPSASRLRRRTAKEGYLVCAVVWWWSHVCSIRSRHLWIKKRCSNIHPHLL